MSDVGQLLAGQVKARVQAEFSSMIANCEATGWKAGWEMQRDMIDKMVAAMDTAVAQDDLAPVKEFLKEYRTPVRFDMNWNRLS